MKKIDFMILFLIVFLIILKPNLLMDFINTFLGKCMILLLIFVTYQYSKFIPILLGILYIYVNEVTIENYENSIFTYNNFNQIRNMRTQHCREVDGKMVYFKNKNNVGTLENAKNQYPDLTFDDASCRNPCDPTCDIK